MYIVSGASGQTGSVVAKELLKKGLPVRVLVRSEEKAAPFVALGAEFAIVDVQNAASLQYALIGGKALYLMNPPNYTSEDMFTETEKSISAWQSAIGNSTLEKLVILSSVGAHLTSGLGNIHTLHMLENAFADSTIPVTFIRASSFMENILPVIDVIKNDSIYPSFDKIDAKIPHVAAEDIGKLAAQSLIKQSEGVKHLELAGFFYDSQEIAKAFGDAMGKTVTAVEIPETEWRDNLSGFVNGKNLDHWVEMQQGINSGHIDFETDDLIAGTITIEDFAAGVLNGEKIYG